jgi:hypothetical protein
MLKHMAHVHTPKDDAFSNNLESWFKSDKPKTLAYLTDIFAEKSFALAFLLLMALPASPIPTGGASHILEIITMLLAIELVINRHTLWLPRHWVNLTINKMMLTKTVPSLVKLIRWIERFSKPHLRLFMQGRGGRTIMGLLVFIFSLAAFLAPPFSDLDILPALGAVIVAIAFMLDDVFVLIVGIIIGSLGIVTIIGLAAIVFALIHKLLST